MAPNSTGCCLSRWGAMPTRMTSATSVIASERPSAPSACAIPKGAASLRVSTVGGAASSTLHSGGSLADVSLSHEGCDALDIDIEGPVLVQVWNLLSDQPVNRLERKARLERPPVVDSLCGTHELDGQDGLDVS